MAAPATQLATALENLSTNQAIRLLAVGKSIGLNATGDNALQVIATAKYSVSNFIVTGATVSLAQAAAGLFDTPAAGGTAIVANAALATATGPTITFQMTVASTTVRTSPKLYFNVGTVNTATAACDVYVYGYDFS